MRILALLFAGLGPSLWSSASVDLPSVDVRALREAVEGEVWLVPSSGRLRTPYPSIQAAVDAAGEGDTVLLSEGVFVGPGNRDVLVEGKDVVVRGEGPPGTSILDCQGRGRGFLFVGPAVTPRTLLRGVWITRANAPSVFMRPGGAIYCEDSAPTIEACTITDSDAGLGGGMYSVNTKPGAPVGVVRDSVFRGNNATNLGGGLFALDLLVDRCVFVHNDAVTGGGGIYMGSRTTVRNTIIARNRATFGDSGGAGVRTQGVGGLISGCTIVNNHSADQTGGVWIGYDPVLTIENSIVYGNTAGLVEEGKQVYQQQGFGLSDALIRYCNIEGGREGVAAGPHAEPYLLEITDFEPELVDGAGDDYHLMPTSPCIDRGDPTFGAIVNEGDQDNQPRTNGRVDLGADEVWPNLALSLPTPGRAGEMNAVSTVGAAPGSAVFFFYSGAPGLTDMSFGACQELVLELSQPMLLAPVTSGSGRAEYGQYVGHFMAGATVYLQAVAFDPTNPAAGCILSNSVRFTYP